MARNEEKLKEAKNKLLPLGATDVQLFSADIRLPSAGERAREFLNKQTLDGILLNSGGPHGKKPSELSADDFNDAHSLLFSGPALMLNALLPSLKRPGGSVVAITSTTVRELNPNLPLSGAYRTALVTLLKSFAEEFGAQGIRFNSIAPGYTKTEMLEELARYVAKNHFGDDKMPAVERVYTEWAERSPLKRLAAPEEIAQSVEFLFSEAASFITGQTLVVDGGSFRGY